MAILPRPSNVLVRLVLMILMVRFVFSIALDAAPPTEVATFLSENCKECHNASDMAGGLDIDALDWAIELRENRERWIRVHDRVVRGEMPPESTLKEAEITPIAETLNKTLHAEISERQDRDGRTSYRRLNRREFENSLHDLLGIDTPLQHLLPEDGRASGYDTVSEGLRISGLQLEKYLEVIELALDDCIRLTETPNVFQKRLRYHDEKGVRENLDKAEGAVDPASGEKHRQLFRQTENAIVFISHGYSPDDLRQFSPPASGLYRIRASAYAVDTRDEAVALKVYSSDWKTSRMLRYFELPEGVPRVVEFTTRLTPNEHLRFAGYGIGIDAQGKSVWNVDTVKDWKVPGMALEWVEIEGPLFEQWPPQSVSRVFGDSSVRKLEKKGAWTQNGHIAYELAPENPKSASADAIQRFAQRAFRRPLQDGQADRFIALAHSELDSGRTYEQAMRVALRSILISPKFLMLEESPGKLDDYALASRLSYCFWSSPPDEELLELAKSSKLSEADVLRAQVDRLLDSPRGREFIVSFAGQWLDLFQIDATTPDAKLYPEYDDLLRDSMVAETQWFFRELLQKNLPIGAIIDSDFVMIDRRLAEHYSLLGEFHLSDPNLYGEEIRRVQLPQDSPRGGIMTHASVLKVTANGTVTSPVLRGAWILRRLIGRPPSPPPPVNAIEPDTRGATTIREQLSKHRDSQTCNRCHREIDPPGFALESFDVIGGFRENYRSVGEGTRPKAKLHGRDIWEYKLGKPVDPSGETSDGVPFSNIESFRNTLLRDQGQISRSLVEQFATYATGSAISFADREEIDRIAADIQINGAGVRTLVHRVVASKLFTHK
jgi:hypothetical protein